eukprot:12269141-Alexandrium_andersonii.AAC.1
MLHSECCICHGARRLRDDWSFGALLLFAPRRGARWAGWRTRGGLRGNGRQRVTRQANRGMLRLPPATSCAQVPRAQPIYQSVQASSSVAQSVGAARSHIPSRYQA